MTRQNQGPINFTDDQEQQLKRIINKLRKLNRDANRELRRLVGTDLTHTQCSKGGDILRIIAIQMISALRVRQGILIAGRRQQPTLIVIGFGLRCDRCSTNMHVGPDDDEPATCEVLKLDPAHVKEIDSLLELARRTEERVSARCESRGMYPIELFRVFSSLTSAILRQQRNLRDTAFKQTPKIKVESDDSGGPDICMDCQRPMEVDDVMDGHNRDIDESVTENHEKRWAGNQSTSASSVEAKPSHFGPVARRQRRTRAE